MKKLMFAMLLLAGLASCKKEDEKPTETTTPYTCPTCTTTPEAKAEYDHSSAGVYKGIIVGSSGTVALHLYNTGTEVKMLVTFDGKSTTLSTTSLSAWAPGQAITAAIFTGMLDGKAITATFSVNPNGQNPVLTAAIPGHTIVVSVYKETSTSMVKSYEGTYDGNDPDNKGTFNMTLNGNDLTIVTSGGRGPIVNVLKNGGLDFIDNNLEIKGSFNGDDVSGTWKNNGNSTNGTWKGKRTL
jgi:hypothetical protein